MSIDRAFSVNPARISAAFAFCLLGAAQSTPQPVLQKFVGVWVEDEAKLKLGASSVPLKFRQAADGGLEEIRGPEAKPLVESVKFGTEPYAIESGSKNTIAWKQIDPSHFERRILNEGKLQNVRRIKISQDGATLVEVTEATPPGGKKQTSIVTYKRVSGGPQGLAGTWNRQSIKRSPAPTVKYELDETGSLKVSDDIGGNQRHFTVKMDSVPVPIVGATVISGTAIAFRVVDDHTLESATSRDGVASAKTTLTLSNDGKVLTTSNTVVGPNGNLEPTVRVYNQK